jgi:hypothetical protein
MPRLTAATPKYRLHRASGQAVVTIAGKDHYLGPWKANQVEYRYGNVILGPCPCSSQCFVQHSPINPDVLEAQEPRCGRHYVNILGLFDADAGLDRCS